MAKTGGGLRATRPANSKGNADLGERLKGRLVLTGDVNEKIARLSAKQAGIPDNFEGNINVRGDLQNGVVYVSIDDDGINMQRAVYMPTGVVKNNYFKITNETGKYSGFKIFNEQVRILKLAGFKKIKVSAAGDINTAKVKGGFNGFYTWLRFGYVPDGDRNGDYVDRFKTWVRNYPFYDQNVKRRLLKIDNMTQFNDHPEALHYWKNVGGAGWSGEFDLREGSYSMKQLAKYARQRKKKGK